MARWTHSPLWGQWVHRRCQRSGPSAGKQRGARPHPTEIYSESTQCTQCPYVHFWLWGTGVSHFQWRRTGDGCQQSENYFNSYINFNPASIYAIDPIFFTHNGVGRARCQHRACEDEIRRGLASNVEITSHPVDLRNVFSLLPNIFVFCVLSRCPTGVKLVSSECSRSQVNVGRGSVMDAEGLPPTAVRFGGSIPDIPQGICRHPWVRCPLTLSCSITYLGWVSAKWLNSK